MKKDLLNSELHMMKKTFCMLFFAAAMSAAFAHRPTDVSLGGEWLFHRGEVAGGEAVSADTSGWERVKVPHDWAIGQAFDMNYDKQYVRDWLETLDWNKQAPGPVLPPEVVNNTIACYSEALSKLMK